MKTLRFPEEITSLHNKVTTVFAKVNRLQAFLRRHIQAITFSIDLNFLLTVEIFDRQIDQAYTKSQAIARMLDENFYHSIYSVFAEIPRKKK